MCLLARFRQALIHRCSFYNLSSGHASQRRFIGGTGARHLDCLCETNVGGGDDVLDLESRLLLKPGLTRLVFIGPVSPIHHRRLWMRPQFPGRGRRPGSFEGSGTVTSAQGPGRPVLVSIWTLHSHRMLLVFLLILLTANFIFYFLSRWNRLPP